MSNETLNAVIRRREDHTSDIAVFELTGRDGEALPPFDPGAHVDVHVGKDLVRQYSLSNDPAQTGVYRLGVLKDPQSRGGSEAVHAQMQNGTELTISVPRNNFPLNLSAPKNLFFGGGIGITPMISMAYALRAAGKPFELHYSVRSRSRAAFLDELVAEFGDSLVLYDDADSVTPTLDVKALIATAGPEVHAYVCGPGGYMDHVITSAQHAGLPEVQIHREYFNAEVDMSGEAFEVVAQTSGVTVQVAEGETIANALKAAGVTVDVSCEQGVCGTCICDVLEGEPDHKDQFLNDEEKELNDQMAVCCSRAKSNRLVLDI